MVRDMYNHIVVVAQSIKDHRIALPLAHAKALAHTEAEPKGGGSGLKAAGMAKKVDDGDGNSSKRNNSPPPRLAGDGKKVWDLYQAASSTGDCAAMKGMFADMGCTLGSLHEMKFVRIERSGCFEEDVLWETSWE
ncbi:MAG: hypothetical protein GOMPHAMPRED_006879 [Gomphillus americanus]|uniref:Uncharacterized protein n=1 Tax=Gomphillus americanus TaxID=1940652 RepID=A0A8H3ESX4_9LECA|nr:MAG: hypothetical protein GOMPHAMPRED_006879 [Gomphillus americanus]